MAKIGCWWKKLKPRVRIWNLELKKIKTPFSKCAAGENFQHHAREAREKFGGLPLENGVFSQFPLLKTAPQAKKIKPRFQLSGDLEKKLRPRTKIQNLS